MSSESDTHATDDSKTETHSPWESPNRQRLEAQANEVRARLLRRVDVLRARARDLRDPASDLARHPVAAAAAIGATGVLLGVGGGLLASRIVNRRPRARATWADYLPGLRPIQVIPAPKSVFVRALEQAVVGVAVAALTTATKAYVSKLFAKDAPPATTKKPRYLLSVPDPFPPPAHK